jgi:hypothetical protein
LNKKFAADAGSLTIDELRTLTSVPLKPSLPTMPTAYTGPVTDDANLFSSYGGTNGGFGIPTITEMTDP